MTTTRTLRPRPAIDSMVSIKAPNSKYYGEQGKVLSTTERGMITLLMNDDKEATFPLFELRFPL